LDDEFGVGDLVETEFQKAKNNAYNAKDLKGMRVMHDSVRIKFVATDGNQQPFNFQHLKLFSVANPPGSNS